MYLNFLCIAYSREFLCWKQPIKRKAGISTEPRPWDPRSKRRSGTTPSLVRLGRTANHERETWLNAITLGRSLCGRRSCGYAQTVSSSLAQKGLRVAGGRLEDITQTRTEIECLRVRRALRRDVPGRVRSCPLIFFRPSDLRRSRP